MNNKIFGYARVSSKDQNEERQVNVFREFGINERDIFTDKQSGKDFNREQYTLLKNILRENDLLVIKSIDRLGRNYEMVINEWKDITKNIKEDIMVVDMPLLDKRNNKDLSIEKEYYYNDNLFKIININSKRAVEKPKTLFLELNS